MKHGDVHLNNTFSIARCVYTYHGTCAEVWIHPSIYVYLGGLLYTRDLHDV